MSVAHHSLSHHGHDHDHEQQEEELQKLKTFGFWLFVSTDMVLFACLFATYLVMRTRFAGGPTPLDIFDVKGFTEETFLLLTSSFTGGLATLASRNGNRRAVVGWLIVTIVLGLGFIGLELQEFLTDWHHGATPQVSGFLSAFFTLVGTHGCHVSMGILWMLMTTIQVARRGLNKITMRKIFVVNLYWHFLDVVWVFIYTVVYLSGMVMK